MNSYQNLDQQIIQLTESGLPLVSEPYRAIAEQLEVDTELVMARLEAMKRDGRIRRIGAVPNHYKLGYTANGMSVWDVDDACVRDAGQQIGVFDFVSHCYQRPRAAGIWPYNLFAMVHGHTRDEVFAQVEQIKTCLGDRVRASDVLFSKRILKKTGFRTGEK